MMGKKYSHLCLSIVRFRSSQLLLFFCFVLQLGVMLVEHSHTTTSYFTKFLRLYFIFLVEVNKFFISEGRLKVV